MWTRYLVLAILLTLPLVVLAAEQTPEEALRSAASMGNEEWLRVLIDEGADVNAVVNGWTALTQAASSNRVESVRLLLEAGADVTLGDPPPLEAAARYNQPEIVSMLIEHGATHTLYSAAGAGDIEVLRGFLAAGADVNARRRMGGQAPLHLAAQNGHVGAITVLVEAGATVDLRSQEGVTPLHEAILRRRLDAARTLLDAGAEIEAPVHGGWYFVSTGRTSNRYRPLHIAASVGHPEMVRMLLDRGADPNGRAVLEEIPGGPAGPAAWPGGLILPPGLTPLHVACYTAASPYGRAMRPYGWMWEGMLEMLIAAGADVNARDPMGGAPLHWSDAERATILLAHGADVNAQDDSGDTPLHRAARSNLQLVELLLEASADATIVNVSGRTPAEVAVQYQREDIADILRHHTAG